MKTHLKVTEAIEAASAKLLAMSDEEFNKLMEPYDSTSARCTPNECHGECQGMGWCYTCEDFRGELPDDHMEDLLS